MSDPSDFFRIDLELTEEERLLQATVRDFVRRECLPDIARHFEEATFPTEIVPKLGALGLLGMKYAGYGCAGASNVDYGLACQELEAGDSGMRSFVSVQTSLVIHPLFTWGSEEQKRRYIPKLAAGELIGCYGLTEPDHGTDPERHGDAGGARRERVRAQRREDVDHQRHDRGSRGRLGASTTTMSPASSSRRGTRGFPRLR